MRKASAVSLSWRLQRAIASRQRQLSSGALNLSRQPHIASSKIDFDRPLANPHDNNDYDVIPTYPSAATSPQHGQAILEASVESTHKNTSKTNTRRPATHLVHVSHRSPLRLVPCRSSSVEQAGAAVVYQASYGGGVVSGDCLDVRVTLQQQATMALLTQGTTRVYPQRHLLSDTTTRMQAQYTLGADSLLVVAPDPLVTLPHSRLEQVSRIHLQDPSASCVVIDWLGGRGGHGEATTDDDLTITSSLTGMTKTQLRCYNANHELQLVDALVMSQDLEPQSQQFLTAVASMLVAGPRVTSVVAQCQKLQTTLVEPFARVRRNHYQQHDDGTILRDAAEALDTSVMESLLGRVILGITKVDTTSSNDDDNNNDSENSSSTYLMRWAAQSNQDLYRCLHYCLQPLQREFGLELYKDRIRATKSAHMAVVTAAANNSTRTTRAGMTSTRDEAPTVIEPTNARLNAVEPCFKSSPRSWAAYILADSALPVGSFAHSAGLEAASQLGLLTQGETGSSLNDHLAFFIESSARSIVQGSVPAILQSHRLAVNALSDSSVNEFAADWRNSDRQAHVFLAGNGPACRASLDQGGNLLRVVGQWLSKEADDGLDNKYGSSHCERSMKVLTQLQSEMEGSGAIGHLSTVFGTTTALLQLSEQEACELFSFCVTRDMVSASVRLNLLGPLASVSVLSRAQSASQRGIEMGQKLVDDVEWAGAVCSPVLEAIQPCHDALAMRLFRT